MKFAIFFVFIAAINGVLSSSNVTLESTTFSNAVLLKTSVAGNGALTVEITAQNTLRVVTADEGQVIFSDYNIPDVQFSPPPYQTLTPASERVVTGFVRPRGIWIAGGAYFIADTLNFVIRRYTYGSGGTLTTFAGQEGLNGETDDDVTATATKLWSPFAGDYYSTATTHYFVDFHGCRLHSIVVGSPNKIYNFYGAFRQCRNDDGYLNKPTGIVATASALFVSERDANRIVRITRDAQKTRTTIIGSTGASTYSPDGTFASNTPIIRPVCLLQGPGGVRYFCERNEIRYLSGNQLSTFGPLSLGHARGIYITASYMVVADSLRDNILLSPFPAVTEA